MNREDVHAKAAAENDRGERLAELLEDALDRNQRQHAAGIVDAYRAYQGTLDHLPADDDAAAAHLKGMFYGKYDSWKDFCGGIAEEKLKEAGLDAGDFAWTYFDWELHAKSMSDEGEYFGDDNGIVLIA